MPVIPGYEYFDVSDDTYELLERDEAAIYGGAVRYTQGSEKGQIVELLKPIDEPDFDDSEPSQANQENELSETAAEESQDNSLYVGIAAVAAAAVGCGVLLRSAVKKIKNVKTEKRFKAALETYLDAAENGTVELEMIDDLLDALAPIKENNKDVHLSAEDVSRLIKLSCEPSAQAAENSNTYSTAYVLEEASETKGFTNNVLWLESYLLNQRETLAESA